MWDAQTGQPLTQVFNDGGYVGSAQFSPDGKRVLTVSTNEVDIWDAGNGRLVTAHLKHGTNIVNSAQFSPDGKWDRHRFG